MFADNFTFENGLFFVLLTLQCFVVSWYLASMLYKRMRRVITEYPPSEYPLLYPRPEAEYHAFHAKFKLGNQILLGLGLAIVGAAIFGSANLLDKGWAMLPWGMFMVQMVPIMIVEVSEFSHAKMLREKNNKKVRVAGIQSRGLSELISLPLFIAWLVLQIVCFWIIAWTDNYVLFIGDSAFVSIAIISLSNIAGVLYIRKLVSGKKMDPHQDPEDRFKASKAMTRSLVFVSMGVSLFAAAMQLMNFFEADYLEPVLMCVYCQLIALFSIPTTLNAMKIEDVNFDVYRETVKQP